tara:strand:+ start:158 stop:283 length:126 start_codon:yes stop_codon:yes gene_type:complete
LLVGFETRYLYEKLALEEILAEKMKINLLLLVIVRVRRVIF